MSGSVACKRCDGSGFDPESNLTIKPREKMNVLHYAQQISNEEYHSRPCMSASGLKTFLKSPAHYKAAMEDRSDTPAFRIGRMVHSAVLEPGTFSDMYQMFDGDRRTKDGKADWQAILDAGAEPIKREELDLCESIRSACGHLFPKGGHPELSFKAEINGVLCQCRPDWLVIDGSTLRMYDLKTCLDASAADRVIYSYGYHIQSVFYQMVLRKVFRDEGLAIEPIEFVFAEKKPPYDVVVRQIDPDIVPAVEQLILDALETFKACKSTGEWPGTEPDHECKIASAPSWIINGLMPDMDLTGFYGEENEAC